MDWNHLTFEAQNKIIESAIYDSDKKYVELAYESKWLQADEFYGLKLIFNACKHLVTPNRDLKAVFG